MRPQSPISHIQSLFPSAFLGDLCGSAVNSSSKIRRCEAASPYRCKKQLSHAPQITNFSYPITLPLCVPWRPLRLCGKSFFKDSAAMIRDHKKNLPNQPPPYHTSNSSLGRNRGSSGICRKWASSLSTAAPMCSAQLAINRSCAGSAMPSRSSFHARSAADDQTFSVVETLRITSKNPPIKRRTFWTRMPRSTSKRTIPQVARSLFPIHCPRNFTGSTRRRKSPMYTLLSTRTQKLWALGLSILLRSFRHTHGRQIVFRLDGLRQL